VVMAVIKRLLSDSLIHTHTHTERERERERERPYLLSQGKQQVDTMNSWTDSH